MKPMIFATVALASLISALGAPMIAAAKPQSTYFDHYARTLSGGERFAAPRYNCQVAQSAEYACGSIERMHLHPAYARHAAQPDGAAHNFMRPHEARHLGS